MTDKERILAEIDMLKRCTMDEHMKFYCESAEAEYNVLSKVELFINSLQEEPASSVWHDASEPPIIDKTFLLVAPNGNSSLCLWGGKELHSVTIGGGHSVLCKGDIYSYIDDLLNLDNFCNFRKNLQEEPVSEDLEKEISDYLTSYHLHIEDGGRIVFDNNDSPNFMCDIRHIAKYFFDLGFKARGGK